MSDVAWGSCNEDSGFLCKEFLSSSGLSTELLLIWVLGLWGFRGLLLEVGRVP